MVVIVGILILIGCAIFQFIAITAGFSVFLGKFFGIIAAMILAPCPFVGTIAGIIGACKGWGWSLGRSLLIFLIPFCVNFFVGYYMQKKGL